MILGICGYGYTGSGALISLLMEFEGVRYLNNRAVQEFTLSYISDGLEDLEFNLVNNPSKGTRCDVAIYRFKLLVDYYERNYNRFTNNKFKQFSYEYLDKLIQIKYKGVRVFEYQRSWKKWLFYVHARIANLFRKYNIEMRLFPLNERYFSIFPEQFVEYTKEYVEKLLGKRDNDCLILDQPFSVGNPLHSMRFFNSPKCIVVDRDPRDLYVMVKYVYKSKAAFIPTNTVENYIEYYKRVRDDRLWRGSNLVYRLQFEDLIYKYNETIKDIERFIGSDLGNHVNPKKFFNPSISIANTNIFSNYVNDADDIKKIESELHDYIYTFPKLNKEKNNVNLNIFTYM